jgi:hypothetical protein
LEFKVSILENVLEEVLMKEVSICHALHDRVDITSISQVPAANGPKIIQRVPASFLLKLCIAWPVPIFELFLNIELHAIFDPLILLEDAVELFIR